MRETDETDTALPFPTFSVNCKIYPGTWGADALEFARLLEEIGAETDTQFVFAPQMPDLRMIAEQTNLAVVAPHVDAVEPGRGMGKILPEAVADAGADGVIFNHPEDRDALTDLVWKVRRCRELGMDSVVIVDSVEMGRSVLEFDPDALVYEKPDDIGTGRAITQSHPERVERFLEMVEEENPRTCVLLGGGITTAEDVRLAFELGADAAGAASAVALADDRETLLGEIAAAVP
jgi:triosephosphate isomerase